VAPPAGPGARGADPPPGEPAGLYAEAGPAPDNPVPAAVPAAGRRPVTLGEAVRKNEEALREARDAEAGEGGWSLADWLALMAFAAALGLMAWAVRWTRGLAPFRGVRGREMAVLDRLAAGRQSTLLVIRLRGRDYWLADHPGGVTLLARLPPPPVPDPDPSGGPARTGTDAPPGPAA